MVLLILPYEAGTKKPYNKLGTKGKTKNEINLVFFSCCTCTSELEEQYERKLIEKVDHSIFIVNPHMYSCCLQYKRSFPFTAYLN